MKRPGRGDHRRSALDNEPEIIDEPETSEDLELRRANRGGASEGALSDSVVKDEVMSGNLYFIDPQIPFEPPPSTPEPDVPFVPPAGPLIDPDVPNKPAPDNAPDLPDQPEADPEIPTLRETGA